MPKIIERRHKVSTGKRKRKDSDIKTVDINEELGIKALYDIKNKIVLSYLFDKSKWSMKESKLWVEEYKSKSTFEVVARVNYLNSLLGERTKQAKEEIFEMVTSKI